MTRTAFPILVALLALASLPCDSETVTITDSSRHRLIILADMGNEPDEEQQMAHMLMCCNEWWQYEEAGTCPGRAFIESADAAKAKAFVPTGAGGKQIHIILEVRDRNPLASLRDYRRVVIDVESRIIQLDSTQN